MIHKLKLSIYVVKDAIFADNRCPQPVAATGLAVHSRSCLIRVLANTSIFAHDGHEGHYPPLSSLYSVKCYAVYTTHCAAKQAKRAVKVRKVYGKEIRDG